MGEEEVDTRTEFKDKRNTCSFHQSSYDTKNLTQLNFQSREPPTHHLPTWGEEEVDMRIKFKEKRNACAFHQSSYDIKNLIQLESPHPQSPNMGGRRG